MTSSAATTTRQVGGPELNASQAGETGWVKWKRPSNLGRGKPPEIDEAYNVFRKESTQQAEPGFHYEAEGQSRRAGHTVFYLVHPTKQLEFQGLTRNRKRLTLVDVPGYSSSVGREQPYLARNRQPFAGISIARVGALTSRDSSPFAEGATDLDSFSKALESTLFRFLRSAFFAAVEEAFEDGFESVFSRTLHEVVRVHGELAVNMITKLVKSGQPNVEVISEAVHQLGFIEDSKSHQSRLATLVETLGSPDVRIRDAASIALAAMDNAAAIPALRRALSQEASPSMRRNFQLVLAQLEETQQWHTF